MTGFLVLVVVFALGCVLLPEPFDYRVRRRVEPIRGTALVSLMRGGRR